MARVHLVRRQLERMFSEEREHVVLFDGSVKLGKQRDLETG